MKTLLEETKTVTKTDSDETIFSSHICLEKETKLLVGSLFEVCSTLKLGNFGWKVYNTFTVQFEDREKAGKFYEEVRSTIAKEVDLINEAKDKYDNDDEIAELIKGAFYDTLYDVAFGEE